jgi:hypothetical protein
MDAGSWVWVTTGTTGTSRSGCLPRGHAWEFRIRARDKVGNYGSWASLKLQT